MKGSITKLGPNHWRLRVYVGRSSSGSPIQASKSFRGAKREAESALAKFVTEHAAKVDRRRDRRVETLAQLLEAWLEHIEAERSAYTMLEYRRKLRVHIMPALGDEKLTALGPAVLDRTYREWRSSGLAPSSVHKLHAIIAAACHQAVKWGWLDRSPTDRATPPKVHGVEHNVMTTDDLRAIRRAALEQDGTGGVLPTAITLGAITGARRGELCAMRWPDLNWSAGVLTIRRSVTVVGSEWSESLTKTRRGRRVPLDDLALAELRARHDAQLSYAEKVGVPLEPTGFMLSRRADGTEPCRPHGLTQAFAALVDVLWPRLGSDPELSRHGPDPDTNLTAPRFGGTEPPRFHFHDLRHFAATMGMAAGYNPRTVGDRLGHADPSMTLRTYTRTVDEQARDLAAALSRAVGLEAHSSPADDVSAPTARS